jgi:hypothetical protein
MTQIEAVQYLVDHQVYTNEWTGAGMWEAVLTVMGNTMDWDKAHLDDLLKKAEDR